jgi:coenzyme F420 hydrogenase subunit beta
MPVQIDLNMCDGCSSEKSMRCVENCMYDAISIQGGKPVVDEAECDECKMCVSICPSHAISLK